MLKWDPIHYDDRLSFVSKYGTSLITLLHPQANERILDLGCGTGHLTAKIAQSGATVIGVDYSEEMLTAAKNHYPHLSFRREDGQALPFEQEFTAVFSNAALHWLQEAEQTAVSISKSLQSAGRFVAEFGGAGNVACIVNCVYSVLKDHGRVDGERYNPWYFPTIGAYSQLLEQAGMEIRFIELYDRPTRLNAGEDGMRDWLNTFALGFFAGFSNAERQEMIFEIEKQLKSELWDPAAEAWIADYRRLRVYAVKL